MPNFMTEFISNIKEKWTSLESKVQRRIVFFSILSLIAIGITTAILTTTEYVVLYTGLDMEEKAEVLSLLEELNIKAQTSDDGAVLIEEEQEEYARMQLSMQGYPKSGLNYDLYLNSISMTSSTQDKNIVLVYQLQDRLRSTIKLLQGVSDAIVTISIDTDETFKFSNETKPVSANVVLDLEGNFRPSKEQVSAIQNLMTTSVSGLRAENLAIIDSNLNDLLPIQQDGSFSALTSSQQEFKNQIEKELEEKILYLFEPVYGSNNFKVAVSTEINFDQVASESIEYSPVIDDRGIEVIVEELTEIYEDNTTNVEAGSDSLNERVQNVVNYRVNEMKESIQRAEGSIEDISVSILINNPELEVAQMEEIRRVAASAIGVEQVNVNASVMDFTAYEEKQQEIEEAMAVANMEDGGLPISERALVGLVASVLAFTFGLIAFFSIRKARKAEKSLQPQVANQTATETRQDSREELTQRVLADALEKQKAIEMDENSKEEQVMRKEIQKIVDKNPKNVADVISYWLESDDAKNKNPFTEDVVDE
ncbi:MAG: flagellar M-ring protein FliF C-terminal domain-containing protein [Clostridia bacterium]